MKNHFFLPYAGNKRQEVKNIYDEIKDSLLDINTIVEPFCGTAAVSYYISTIYPKKFQYVLNDNNKHLITLYETGKNDISLNLLIDDIKILYDKTTTKEEYMKLVKNANDNFLFWLYINIFYSIRPGLFPSKKVIKKERIDKLREAPIINFLKNENVLIICQDWKEVYQKYNKKNIFLFFDPPYLSSCNSFYKCPTVDVYEYLSLNDIKKEESFICLCLENMWIIKLLFKCYIKKEYNKKYETSKRETSHLIILNR